MGSNKSAIVIKFYTPDLSIFIDEYLNIYLGNCVIIFNFQKPLEINKIITLKNVCCYNKEMYILDSLLT